MKIAIDITAITTARGNFGDKSGVYRYTLNLIKGLINQKQKTDIIYLIDFFGIKTSNIPDEISKLCLIDKVIFKSFPKPIFFHFKKTKFSKIPVLRWFLKKIDCCVLDKIYQRIGWFIYTRNVNIFLEKEKIDLIHFSDTVYFPTKIKNILTVHDLVPFVLPEFQKEETIEIHKRRLEFIEKYTSGVICVSQNTQKDFNKICKTKIPTKVIYEGSDNTFHKIDKKEFDLLLEKLSNDELKKIKWKEFYLSYGTIEPRKNYETLIKTYSELYFNNKITKKLVIVGGKGWGGIYEKLESFIKENSLEKQIILFGFASDRILNSLLNGSYCLIYPSLYEGFGLPPLEAMNLGIPTVTSDTSSLPEVVGNGALMFPPRNTKKLENLFIEIEKDKRWKEQSEYSLKRSKQFSWDITGKDTIDFYRETVK